MIKINKGNILNVTEGFIVHGCNCRGEMGAGVDVAIRSKYPIVYERYRKRYENVGLNLASCQYVEVSNSLVIVNAMTQLNYGTNDLQLDYVALKRCFENVNEMILRIKNYIRPSYSTSLNFPMIGCGLAGGNWEIVSEIIDDVVSDDITKNLWVL
jgi:O-acetyl-ADP-ribose deacetylase (regulator of RNase III)